MTIRRTCQAAGIAVVLVGGLGLVRSRAQNDRVDPLKVAPDTTRLLFENAFVRVTEETVAPGQGLPRHQHPRGVTVSLGDYDAEQKIYPGGQIVRAHRSKGETRWAEPVDHETRNVGTTIQNVVRIDLK